MISRRLFTKFSSSPLTSKYYHQTHLIKTISQKYKRQKFSFNKTFILPSLLICFNINKIHCREEQEQKSQFEQVNMQELVELLNHTEKRQFVVIIYDRFSRGKQQFAQGLKNIISSCKKADISNIYTINSKDAQFLNQITRRLHNKQKNKQQSKEKIMFQCHFKHPSYPSTFVLINSKDYTIDEQISQLRQLQIKINQSDILQHLHIHMHNPYNFTKNIVVKQCIGEGQCVDSFRKEVKRLIDDGMFNRKKDQFEFKVVVDHPTGLLNKSTQYIKDFNSGLQTFGLKGKKEDTYLFRNDILGKETKVWTSWLQKLGLNYKSQDRLLMFLQPRINIISKNSMLTDLLWYLKTSKLNNQISLSLNNTSNWLKQNTLDTLQVLKLLYKEYPNLNYLIINSKAAGQLIHHIHADHKYVIFQQSHSPIWNKQFLDLDKLQSKLPLQRQQQFTNQFKPIISQFIDNPSLKDMIVVQKQMQINFNKLKQLKMRQIARDNQKYVIRICRERCNRFISQDTLHKLQDHLGCKLHVYWIDNTAQNIGVSEGNYLLTQGQLKPLQQLL